MPDRAEAALMGQEIVEIIQRGSYLDGQGQRVEVAAPIAAARAGTIAYPPEAPLPTVQNSGHKTIYEVTGESTLEAGRRLWEAGSKPVALNFASARSPGGGFLTGARAQEESIARSSGLFACLDGHDFYRYHRHRNGDGGLYSSYALYSPEVPILRDDKGTLLNPSWPLSIITCAAPNAKVMFERERDPMPAISAAFEERIRKLLCLGAHHGHEAIILGAWGCGAFGNDPRIVAPVFGRILRDEFGGVFRRVTFAVLDGTAEKRFIGPFEREFGPRADA